MKQENSISSLPLRSIRIDHGIQQRAQMLDAGIIAEYAEAMKSASKFPPVTVYYDGANYWLSDGYHRVEAADEAGLKSIAAEVREGTKRDATLHACGANRDHGLRRTRADVRRAITTLVTDAEWGSLTNRVIAATVGCSDKTVAVVRDQLGSCGNSAPEDTDQGSLNTEPQLGNLPNGDALPPDLEEIAGDVLSGSRQAIAMTKAEGSPPAHRAPPAKRTGRDGKSYPTTKAKPAPQPAPAVNKARVAMQAAHGVAAALVALQPLETDLLPEDAVTVMSNLRSTLARLEERFVRDGMEVGHA